MTLKRRTDELLAEHPAWSWMQALQEAANEHREEPFDKMRREALGSK